ARRIVFGKFLNCGQTCVAPDFILCDEKVLPRLVEALKQEITKQFGENPLDNPNYGKIINEKHFTRLLGLLDPKKTVIGGKRREVTSRLDFGGGCINDTIIHLATSHLPFGGVGESGMGSYHGKAGFAAFSHQKAIVDKKTWLDLPMRYQPYKKGLNRKLVRLFL